MSKLSAAAKNATAYDTIGVQTHPKSRALELSIQIVIRLLDNLGCVLVRADALHLAHHAMRIASIQQCHMQFSCLTFHRACTKRSKMHTTSLSSSIACFWLAGFFLPRPSSGLYVLHIEHSAAYDCPKQALSHRLFSQIHACASPQQQYAFAHCPLHSIA